MNEDVGKVSLIFTGAAVGNLLGSILSSFVMKATKPMLLIGNHNVYPNITQSSFLSMLAPNINASSIFTTWKLVRQNMPFVKWLR